MVLHDQYTQSAYAAFSGDVTIGSDIRVALLDATHTPDLDNHMSWDDVSADEVTGTNYTAGGELLTTISWTAGSNAITFDADDVTWADSTITADYAVIYDDTPADDLDKTLLQLVDFEGEESSDNGDFTISWDAAGIFEHTPRP